MEGRRSLYVAEDTKDFIRLSKESKTGLYKLYAYVYTYRMHTKVRGRHLYFKSLIEGLHLRLSKSLCYGIFNFLNSIL